MCCCEPWWLTPGQNVLFYVAIFLYLQLPKGLSIYYGCKLGKCSPTHLECEQIQFTERYLKFHPTKSYGCIAAVEFHFIEFWLQFCTRLRPHTEYSGGIVIVEFHPIESSGCSSVLDFHHTLNLIVALMY